MSEVKTNQNGHIAKAFEKEIADFFARIPGIEIRWPAPNQRRHFDFDFQILNGAPIGLPGPVMVDVKYRKNSQIGADDVDRVVSMLLGEDANPTWLIITNTYFSENAISHAQGFKLRLWGASELDSVLEKHKYVVNDVQRFLAAKREPLSDSPPQVVVRLSDKGWNIPADRRPSRHERCAYRFDISSFDCRPEG